MKKILVIIIFVFICSALSAQNYKVENALGTLAEKLTESYKKNRNFIFKKNIAVIDFADKSKAAKDNNVGETVKDILSTKFSRSTIFNLVERNHLKKVLKEQSIQMSGITDEDSAVKTGKLLNADILLFGSITEIKNSFSITAKMVDVVTGKTTSETISIDKKDIIADIEYRLDMEFVQEMGVGISVNFFGATLSGSNPGYHFPLTGEAAYDKTYFGKNVGVEVKYRVTRNIMFGFGINQVYGQLDSFITHFDLKNIGLSNTLPNVDGDAPFVITATGYNIPIKFYLGLNPLRRLHLYVAGGIEITILDFDGYFEGAIGGGAGFGKDQLGPSKHAEPIIGIVRVGAEFFITPRLALGIELGYDIGATTLDFSDQPQLTTLLLQQEYDINFNGFSFMPSISFYF